jgi:protein SCO1/2
VYPVSNSRTNRALDEAEDTLGPDPFGVTENRDKEWLPNWLRTPQQMLVNNDTLATASFVKYNELAIPNLRLNRMEAEDLHGCMTSETEG